MDIKDIDNLSKRDSPGWMASVVVHIGIMVMMMVIYVPVPEELNPIQIIMSSAKDDEDSIIMDEEPYVNQEMVDWFAEIETAQEAAKLAETILEPDFKPADISPIEDPIFNPEPQKGDMSLSEVNPADLMGGLSEKLGSNSKSNEMGNPLTGTIMEGGTGGDGQVGGMLKKLAGLGAKRGKITVSLFWNTTDDLDLHLVKQKLLPKEGQWFKDMCCFQNQKTEFAHLDIDMNVYPNTNDAVENIYLENFVAGRYGVYVHWYRKHTSAKAVKYTVLFQEEGEKPRVFHGSVTFRANNYASKRIHTFWVKHRGKSQSDPAEPESPSSEEVPVSPFVGI
jgi:hypothetical protein